MNTDGPAEGDPAIGGWVSTKAAAARLGVVPPTLYRLIDLGELPAYRFGRVIRLRLTDGDDLAIAGLELGSGTSQPCRCTAQTSQPWGRLLASNRPVGRP